MKDKQTIFDLFEEFENESMNTKIFEEFEIETDTGIQLNEDDKGANQLITPKSSIDTETLDTIEVDVEEENKIEIVNKIEDIENLNFDESKSVKVNVSENLFDEIEGYGKVNIVALGVGGCGVNTIGRMQTENVEGIKLISLDTSRQSLEVNDADAKILLGENFFNGHGSGAQFDKLHEMFQAEKEKIKELLADTDMLFITGGIGRGTGSVGLGEIGKIAQEMGILTIGFATLSQRSEADEATISKYYDIFLDSVDSNIVIENDRVFDVAKNISINKAVKIADKMLVDGIKGISDLITCPGKINLDYADIRTAFKDKGACVMGVGYGSGNNAVVDAIEEAINSKIINFENIRNAKVIIFNITCAKNTITVEQATRGTDLIYSYNYDENIDHLLFGYSYDDTLGDDIKVTFVATGTTPTEINYKKTNVSDDIFGELIMPQTRNVDPEIKSEKSEVTKELEIPDFLNRK